MGHDKKIPRPLNIGMVHNISETATTAARIKRIEPVTELPGCYNVWNMGTE